jgi:hypothetical protein
VKRSLPIAIAVTSAIIIIVTLCFNVPAWLGDFAKQLDRWVAVSTAVVCGVGMGNLTKVHMQNAKKQGSNWGQSILLLVITYGLLVLGLISGPSSKTYGWIFQSTVVPLGATVYAMLAFYTVSAAYRAFRAKTRDAAVLLVAALIVLMGKAPLGEYIWSGFGVITQWIMDIPQTAAMRALSFGMSIGALITGVRILIGIERPYLGSTE